MGDLQIFDCSRFLSFFPVSVASSCCLRNASSCFVLCDFPSLFKSSAGFDGLPITASFPYSRAPAHTPAPARPYRRDGFEEFFVFKRGRSVLHFFKKETTSDRGVCRPVLADLLTVLPPLLPAVLLSLCFRSLPSRDTPCTV